MVFISLASPEPCSRALGGPFEDDEWRSGATRSRKIFREVVKIAVVSAHLLLVQVEFKLGHVTFERWGRNLRPFNGWRKVKKDDVTMFRCTSDLRGPGGAGG